MSYQSQDKKRDEKGKLTDVGHKMFDDLALIIKDILEKESQDSEMQKAA